MNLKKINYAKNRTTHKGTNIFRDNILVNVQSKESQRHINLRESMKFA